jgi:hypothetical protein
VFAFFCGLEKLFVSCSSVWFIVMYDEVLEELEKEGAVKTVAVATDAAD